MDSVNPARVLYTIGHSSHSIEKFVDLLKLHDIRAVADVRSVPYSRFSPQYSREALESSLTENGIEYVFLGRELGARREEQSCYRDGKVDFELVAQSPLFRDGLKRLALGISKMRVAIMCAEKDPLDCHRTILVARHFREIADDVRHILANGELEDQMALEQRLLRDRGGQDEDLFVPCWERVENAYRRKADAISYSPDQSVKARF